MTIYLCGVFDGPLTGQLQTLIAVKNGLKKTYDVKEINYPASSIFFIFDWISFTLKNLFTLKSGGKNDIFYILLNRSRLSFWIRDLPIFITAFFCKSKIICHLVGSDLEEFVKGTNALEKFIIGKCFANINSWVLLGNSMRSQVINVYDQLEIKNASKCFHNKKLRSFFLKGFYPKECMAYLDKSYIKRKLSNYGSNFKITFMSNLMEDKGIVEFIESMIQLYEKYNIKIEVCIAGGIVEHSSRRLKKALKKAESKKFINFLGIVTKEDKWNLLSDTDIFILPTYYKTEALPLSLVEAMRFGCLCISSNIGEIFDLLKDNRGILLEKVTTENLLDVVSTAIEDLEKSKLKIVNSFNYAEHEFSYDNYQKNLIDMMKGHSN